MPLIKIKLHWQVLIAMVLGALFATLFGEVGWVNQVAEVFLRLLRMVIVPLIFTSIVSGVAGITDGKSLGRLGVKTLLFYTLTSFLAILLGLVLANLLRPGDGLEMPSQEQAITPESLETPGSLTDIVTRLIPTNPVQAAADFDILGLIFFSIVLGAVIASMGSENGKILRSFFDAAFDAILRMTQLVIKLLPIGVFALISRAISQMGFEVFEQVGKYMVMIALGLSLHLLVTLPLLYLILVRRSPLPHYRAIGPAMAMAFSTSSSAATLPMTMTSAHEAGVSKKVSSFVLPMGSTVNMDGTALYECAGALFIAQALSVGLSVPQQITVVITALLASVGAAAVPSAGLVMIFIVLEAIGLTDPAAYALVGLMLGVDRPLDMFRTVVNITSDTVCAAVIAHSEGELGPVAEAGEGPDVDAQS